MVQGSCITIATLPEVHDCTACTCEFYGMVAMASRGLIVHCYHANTSDHATGIAILLLCEHHLICCVRLVTLLQIEEQARAAYLRPHEGPSSTTDIVQSQVTPGLLTSRVLSMRMQQVCKVTYAHWTCGAADAPGSRPACDWPRRP
jgi:hypothetical protein